MTTKKVYMTDEELNAAGFGFLTKNPRIKQMPEVGVTFKVNWNTNEFHSVEAGNIHRFQSVKHENHGEVIFAGKDIAVIKCNKTSKEFSVDIDKTIFLKLT